MATVIETFESLNQQQKSIQEQRAALRAQSIEEVKAMIAAFQITPEEIGIKVQAKRAAKSAKKQIAPKYALPTGETWSGRGKPPKAFAAYFATGKTKADCLIAK